MKRTPALLLCLGLLSTGCRPDILVEVVSRIYPDGSIDRQVDVSGREKPSEDPPDTPGWLRDKSGLVLANPGQWDRVESSPSSLHAEGIFRSAEDVPPILAHVKGPDQVPDRQQVNLERDDLVILTRWRYRESLGDPYGPADVDAALNAILELVADYFREELTAMYGDRIDLQGVERFLNQQAGPIAREFLGARQSSPGVEKFQARYDRWRSVLSRYDAPVVYPGELEPGELPPDFWELQTDPLLEWSREQLAAAITTDDETVEPRHLQFIPDGEHLEERLVELLVRLYGSEEDGLNALDPLFQAIEGHYASGGSSRYRFRCRLELPGTILTTNGVTENDGLVWFFRGEDLAGGDRILFAESVELNLRALKALSARRSLGAQDLLNLVDILGERDPDDRIKERLKQAIEAGNLELLEDEEEELPPDLQPLALELAELLRRR
ncbi:MAG: hypothetical protein IFK94_02755 [Acidobacteria bacterium]|uniref:Uncharacterized protein n=1 Tax=Candidatus Polarisedimenticola svalbardensis TaxID=2886004 RepID=A0A8J7C1B9_9BACT|nr:hypothetical protein [Candidatus Polarisedimenticola svalbardensis]